MARVEPYLLSYDIADVKRLRRVHKLLKKWGFPVQYSVFTLDLDARSVETLMARLSRITDPDEDDVRLYRMPKQAGIWMGPPPIGEGVILTGQPSVDMVRAMVKRGEKAGSEDT